jgi:hypothetical protein
LGDLAQIIWLNNVKELSLKKASTGQTEILNDIDRVFAYWK